MFSKNCQKVKMNQLDLRQQIIKTQKVPNSLGITDSDDLFFTNEESLSWIYYNPDSNAGGQFVHQFINWSDIYNEIDKYDCINNPHNLQEFFNSIMEKAQTM